MGFDESLAAVLIDEGDNPDTPAIEGAHTNDPVDRGGATRYGITEAVARRHGYTGSMAELPYELAAEIYRADYWAPLRLDELTSERVADKVFDLAVNMGPAAGARILQRAIVINGGDLVVDGRVGPATLGAANELASRHELALLAGVVGFAFQRYERLVERDPSQSRFIRGWLSRLVRGL